MRGIKLIPKVLSGKVTIPPSKSMGHRAIICAALSRGKSIIENIAPSEDMIATIEGMRALGAQIEVCGQTLKIDGTHTLDVEDAKIDCNESGSTLRFLVPISIATSKTVQFVGKGNLGKRPLTSFYNIFDEQGIDYTFAQDHMDLKIRGQLSSGVFELPGNISSQFISGLLFALPLLEGDSEIQLTTPLESKGYIDLTLQMMARFGIVIEVEDNRVFKISGSQSYRPSTYKVEGDYSQAAFYLVAGAIGNDVLCQRLDAHSLQGDKAVLDVLQEMGSNLQEVPEQEGVRMLPAELRGITIDGSQYPDIIPILTVAAALADGETHIIRAERLRIKECDRLQAITSELTKLGANITELEDGLIIQGVATFKGNVSVSSHADHRIAMSLAIAATRCEQPIYLENPDCVNKSYPNFWEDYYQICGQIEEEER